MSRLEHAIAKVEEAETVDGFDLVIVDTPPNLDHWDVQARQIVARAEHVLVPTLQGRADIDSVREWMKLLQRQDASAAFLLNATNRQTKSFIAARSALLKVGTLCPIDVRRLEDVQLTHSLGCGLCEMKNVKGSEDLEGLWDHVRRVMRI
jgi:cellulose biosynthesis protein BcsQ